MHAHLLTHMAAEGGCAVRGCRRCVCCDWLAGCKSVVCLAAEGVCAVPGWLQPCTLYPATLYPAPCHPVLCTLQPCTL